MFGAVLVRGNKGQVYFRSLGRRKLPLCLFGSFPKPLQGHAILAKVNACVLFEFINKPIQNFQVEVIPSKVGVPVCRFYFKNPFPQFQNRNIEGAASQIVDSDCFFFLLIFIKAKGQRRRGRLVDDALYVQAGNFAGVLCRLALGVVEVSGDGNNRLCNGLAQIVLGGLLHLL